KPAAPSAPAPTAAPAAKPEAPAPAAPSAPAPGASDIAALQELAQKMKEQNHFERLGVGADTNGPAVRIAYFKLAKLYHPDTIPPGAPPEMEKLKADIFAYIGEAHRTLADEKSRAAYIEELKSGGNKEAEVDVVAILKSEELFRKAGVYLKGRKFAEAVKLLDEAIQLNDQEAEFYAWRGYARFFTFEDKKAGFNEAYKDIQLCLKKNDKVAAGHYFLGVIAKLCGDMSGALKHFQKTVELQPNHIEAQRELRMAAQKK
ncbi:J domain-containing protein, partial [Cystobacter fuscus]